VRLSLCLIAKNEESNLTACLTSVAELVDEMIVVDTGSTDRTKEVAAACGARVFDFPWVDDFAAARNESLRHATGDWILWLDGDEKFDADNYRKMQALVAGLKEENVAYVLKQRSSPGAAAVSPTVVDQVRIFRNHPAIRWQYRVHEQILLAVRRAGHEVRFTDILVEHTGYEDPALRQRKTERNLRLLHLEDADRPNDPFTLFNLGWTYQELGQPAKALPFLRRSLERSQPGDSIVRKLYALIAQGHRQLGQRGEALAACHAGQAHYPDDAELLYLESQLRREQGDADGAEACLRRLLHVRPGVYFASQDTWLRGPKTRFHLAQLYQEQGRLPEAEEQWRAALAEQPDFHEAWLKLGELHLAQGRWAELEQAVDRLLASRQHPVEAAVLRARGWLARKEFAAARQLLEEIIARAPLAVRPRVILTHVLLQEGQDAAATERALRELLELDPKQAESWRNLALFLRQQGRPAEALSACQQGRARCPEDADLLLQHGLFLREGGDLAGAEGCLLRFLAVRPHAGDADPKARAELIAARHNLAQIYFQQRRQAEAEAQWRAVLADQPDFAAAALWLGELCLGQQRWAEVEQLATQLQHNPEGKVEGAVLRARGLLARQEFAAARTVLLVTIAHSPQALWPRVILSRVLLQEGLDWPAAEQALRDVLALDPNQTEARRNLALLLRRQGQGPETSSGGTPPSLSPSASVATPSGATEPGGPSIRPLPRACLRLAFASFSPFAYRVDSPYRVPLGGTESALCYLAEAVARRGHQVFLLNHRSEGEVSRGVQCLPLTAATVRQLPPLDVLIVSNVAGRGPDLRSQLTGKPCLVLWTGHGHDQPAVKALHDPAERAAYDGIALVSDWQRRHYVAHFGLVPERTAVLRNAIAPAFQGLFPTDVPILGQKCQPPVLAYTSTPFRGLDLLLEAFPQIRRAVPGATLKVFSSMKVYQVSEPEDQSRYGGLYHKCRATEGVQYLGSLPQPELAAELRWVSVLAYPNTFAETSCIAVLEAMASGCWVVTSDQGALPETTAGFARLIPEAEDRESYLRRFVEETVTVLTHLAAGTADAESHLRRQVTHINQNYTWPALAEQWIQWLSQLRACRS
jgi:tetratricopeptide (TPR) repeat protein/glycosyltransferase involved in cell wall biosynthesis